MPTAGTQRQRTLPEAAMARKEGIQIFVVGVTDLIDEDTLKGISSLPQEMDKNYFTSPDFEGLSGVLDSVMKSACSPLESKSIKNILWQESVRKFISWCKHV